MTVEERQNQLMKEYRKYLSLDEKEKALFWQDKATEMQKATEEEKEVSREAVFANMDLIKQRVLEIKKKLEESSQITVNK